MGKAIDIAGEQYGNLTAVKVNHLGKKEIKDIGYANAPAGNIQCSLSVI